MFRPDGADSLLMIPGPTPVAPEILAALAEPTIAHTSAGLATIVGHCQVGIRSVAGAEAATVFLFAGSGTLAQEAAIVNLVPPGASLLVTSNGYFGDRFRDIAEAHGMAVSHLAAEPGKSVSPDALDEQLGESGATTVTLTHVDTATGVAAPLRELVRVAKKHGALVIVDAVCSLGGMQLDMDAWGIDVVLSGAQKALGVPPGLVILAVSEAAMARRRSINRVPSYYADLLNWEASMRDPKQYFSTHAVNLFYALDVALQRIADEGLSARIARHVAMSQSFRAGMAALSFSPMTDPAVLAPTLSVLAYPVGVDDQKFRDELTARGVIAAGCLGSWRGKGVRFGHMGNMTTQDIERGLRAVQEVVGQDGAVAAARQFLGETART
jgi:alanine-glyoxylate transaminase / serine-glyoxylate transaminase / serine-pyruvate transaminase